MAELSYNYSNSTSELQEAVDIALAISGIGGVIQSDGAGGITAKAFDPRPISGSNNLLTSGKIHEAIQGIEHMSILDTEYAVTNTQTAPTVWQGTIPAVGYGQFLWIKFIWADDLETIIVLKQGVSAGISATDYGVSSSVSVEPSSWQSTIPTVQSGDFLWTRFTWNDGSITKIVALQGTVGTFMEASDYDSDSAVKNAGGIAAYVQAQISSALTDFLDGNNILLSSEPEEEEE